MDMIEGLLNGNEDYEATKPFIYKVLSNELFMDDRILKDLDGIYVKATNLLKADLASRAEEK